MTMTVTTVLGNGVGGYADDQVNNPFGVIIGTDGALSFCDLDNQMIRRLDLTTNAVSTIAQANGLITRRDPTLGIIRIFTSKENQIDLATFREEETEVFTLLYPNAVNVGTAIREMHKIDGGYLQQHDVDGQLAALFASTQRAFELAALDALARSRLHILTLADALDLDTLRLLGMLGPESSALNPVLIQSCFLRSGVTLLGGAFSSSCSSSKRRRTASM